MSQWKTLRWPQIERKVWKLPTRLYRAAPRGDHRPGRRRQKRLRRAHQATLVAVRQVTHDNRGKKTPGVDGRAALTPPERLAVANTLPRNGEAAPVRRVYIPKPGTDEHRPVGLPTMADRAKQGGVKYALAPAGDAPLEPNRDGFRPGRSPWDAIGAIDVPITQTPTWGLEADLAHCCDRIDHAAW